MRFLIGLIVLFSTTGVAANPDQDVTVPSPPAATQPVLPTAEWRYNQGQSLGRKGDWAGAEGAYRDATRLKAEFPEAWNGLGHSLRKLGRLEESVKAYQEALRLRPKYPQALEYLGQAYVEMRKLSEAREVLDRLRPLDRKEADELAAAIAKAAKR